MADTYTTNLNLKKPGYDSPADIKDLNDNFDKIDTSVNQLSEQMADYRTAVNLLDNSNMAIAQAGYNAMHGEEKYGADRWPVYGGDISYNGSHFTFNATAAYGFFYQKHNVSDLTSDVYTFAISQKGSVRTQMRVYGIAENGSEVEIAKSGIISNNGAWTTSLVVINRSALDAYEAVGFYIYHIDAGSVTYKDLAVYPGEYSIDNLPPYVPKGYASELAECQRYYYRISGQRCGIVSYAIIKSNTTARAFVPLHPMRNFPNTIPSLWYSGSISLASASNSHPITNITVDEPSYTSSGIMLNLTFETASALAAGDMSVLQFYADATAYLEFSADL